MGKRVRHRQKSKRDYAAEYKRRVARATSKGYSRAIARGHAPKGVIGLSLAAKLRVPVGTEIDDITIKTVNADPASERQIRKALKKRGLEASELRGIEFTDQETFVRQMLGYGFTFREAFDLYFGY